MALKFVPEFQCKRFQVTRSYLDESRWKRTGERNFKLMKPDRDKDKWIVPAGIKVLDASGKPFGVKEAPAGKVPGQGGHKINLDTDRILLAGTANANIVDRVQERIDPRGGIFEDYLKNPQLLAHHSYYCPVGQVETLDVQDDGVHFAAWCGDPAAVGGMQYLTEMQREMRSLLLQQIIRAVSIGFIPHDFKAPLYNDNGEMEEPLVITRWELLEISLVAVPCNQLSLIGLREANAA